jgi:heptosyltransferase III
LPGTVPRLEGSLLILEGRSRSGSARILLIKPGAIGDCITWLPVLERFRQAASYLEVWTNGRNVPLIRRADAVRSIAAVGLDLMGLPDVAPPASLLEHWRSFDQVVSWYGTRRSEFREPASALRVPVQFFPALPEEWGDTHAVDFFLDHAATLLGPGPREVPRLHCPGGTGESGFIVLHPFSGSRKKNWPLERFVELGDWLQQRGARVQYCAGPEDPLEDAVRFDDLYKLACWLSRAALFIGNDSGPAHIAAATGTNTIVLFGPSNPRVWAPRGTGNIVVVRAGSGEGPPPVEAISLSQVQALLESTV